MSAAEPILDSPWPRRAGCWAFPIVLWLFATLALGGAIGKSTDDYSTNLRDPVTGRVATFQPFRDYPYFWRPAHVAAIHTIQTYLWERDGLIHALSAALHGLVVLLLYRLIVRVTRSPPAAAAAALVFLVVPAHHEAVFFTSTIGTLVGAALWLWLALAVVRYGAGAPRFRRAQLPIIAVISLAIPFFYEQPGSAAVALPLLVIATGSSGRPRDGRARCAAAVALSIGLTQAAMAAALLLTAPSGRRGSAASLAPFDQWPASFVRALARMLDLVAGGSARETIAGSLILAKHTLSTTHLWIWLIALALTGAAFLLAAARGGGGGGLSPDVEPLPASSPVAARRRRPAPQRASLLLVVTGIAAAILAVLPPALVSGQVIVPRLTYMPLLGLAVALGGALGLLETALGPARSRLLAAAAAPVVAAASAIGAISLVGFQEWFRLRANADDQIASQLRTRLPALPPGSILVPLRLDSNPARTGIAAFDQLRPGAFETIWSATAISRQALGRRDIWAAACNRWRMPPLDQPTETTVRLRDRFVIWSPFPPSADGGGTTLPWSRVLPFIVDAQNRVQIVDRIGIDDERGTGRSLPIPLAAPGGAEIASPAQERDARTHWLTDASPVPGAGPIAGWRFTAAPRHAADAAFASRSIWGQRRECEWMHATAEGGARATLRTQLDPSDHARRIVVRATIAGFDFPRAAPRSAAVVRLEAPGCDAAEIRLSAHRVRREQRWIPLVLDLPPSSTPVWLELTVRTPADAVELAAPVWVSTGILIPDPPSGSRIMLWPR